MSHPFAAYFLFRYFHTAAVAHDAFITDTLVLSAGALIIFHRTDPFAEQTVAFGLVGAVVNGFRL